MTGRLSNKVAFITGAAQGMGECHARGFIQEGARVVVADINSADGMRVAKSLGDRAIFFELDVTDPKSWSAAVAATEKAFGPVNVLVNNAGIGEVGHLIADCDLSRWRKIFDVNVFGVFNGIKAVVPSMRKTGSGSIINVASAHGLIGGPMGASSYTASKFAVVGLTKTAALDLSRDRIRVNTLCPGVIITPLARDAIGLSNDLTKNLPIPRLGTAEEITPLAVFLASDESSFCTGTEFCADGGMQAGFFSP